MNGIYVSQLTFMLTMYLVQNGYIQSFYGSIQVTNAIEFVEGIYGCAGCEFGTGGDTMRNKKAFFPYQIEVIIHLAELSILDVSSEDLPKPMK